MLALVLPSAPLWADDALTGWPIHQSSGQKLAEHSKGIVDGTKSGW